MASVTAKLDGLGKQNEVLTEKYNKAQIEVASKQKAADAAKRTAGKAAKQLRVAQATFAHTLAAQYEGAAFSTTGALLTSHDGQNYLDKLSSLDMLSAHRAQVVAQITEATKKADAAQKTAQALLAKATAARDAIAKQRSQIIADTAKFTNLLATLTAAQQAAYRDRNTVATTPAQAEAAVAAAPTAPASTAAPQTTPAAAPTAGVSAAAQKAVQFALAQVGKAYVFAASGPDAYDCSGLTMAAWAQAGVSLPHLASAQYGYGTHVSVDQLTPGDLIFLYSPISHVEIYVGNGMAVSAADEALGVRMVNIANDMGDWAGATHIE